MRDFIKETIRETLQDLINTGSKTTFTRKQLDELGVRVPEIHMTSVRIQKIREKKKLSQPVFAKLLNVSPSSVKKWERGDREPTGSTKVLLELLEKSPNILDYRLEI